MYATDICLVVSGGLGDLGAAGEPALSLTTQARQKV
jgi:hypothetical protein